MSLRLLALALLVMTVFAGHSFAGSELNGEMAALMKTYLAEAQKEDPAFKAFSAEEGKKLFYSKRMHSKAKKERGCTTCHTSKPENKGKTPAGKVIEPISPAVNKERFTSPKRMKKWFRRNCKWVLERQCTPKEKGDFITFMMSL